MPDEKISGTQAVILLFLSRAFNTLNYVPAFHDSPGGSSMIYGSIIAAAIELLALIPALLLNRRYEGRNVIMVGYERARPLGIVLAAAYSCVLFLQISGSLTGFEYFLTNAVYPTASASFIVLTMSAACFWAAGQGLQGTARTAGIVFIFFLLSTLFIFGVSAGSANLLNVHPELNSPLRSALRAGLASVSKSPELFLLILLFPKINGSKAKCGVGLVLSTLALNLISSFLIVAVLGEFGATQTFPYFTLASVSELSIFQRLDSLHMTIWVFVAFLRIALLINLARYCLESMLPVRARRWIFPVLFLLSAGAAIFLGHSTELLKEISPSNALVQLLLTAGVPLLLLLTAGAKRHAAAVGAKP